MFHNTCLNCQVMHSLILIPWHSLFNIAVSDIQSYLFTSQLSLVHPDLIECKWNTQKNQKVTWEHVTPIKIQNVNSSQNAFYHHSWEVVIFWQLKSLYVQAHLQQLFLFSPRLSERSENKKKGCYERQNTAFLVHFILIKSILFWSIWQM